jgi:hypothetical protein
MNKPIDTLLINNNLIPLIENKEQKDNFSKFAKKILWAISIPSDPIIGLFTQSLADMLCLETLSHGTSIWNYLSIRVEGADPQFGGKEGGSSYTTDNLIVKGVNSNHWQKDSTGWLFLYKDAGIIDLSGESRSWNSQDGWSEPAKAVSKISIPHYLLISKLIIPFLTRMHAGISGYGSPLPYQESSPHILTRIIGAVTSIFTPTINFRFIPEDVNSNRYDKLQTVVTVSKDFFNNYNGIFFEDTSYGGIAWKTQKKIKTENIGLYSILCQGLKGNLKDRIQKNPLKFLYGTIRLVSLTALTILILI